MRIGISSAVGRREPLTRVPVLASKIEQAGFDRLWYVDYQLPMKDAVVAMTLAAQATSTIEIGPGVANPMTRHVSVLTNAMNAIHELSGGRAVVGIGAGHSAVHGVGLQVATIAQMRESVVALRRLLAGDEVQVTDGPSYQVQTRSVSQAPPVLVAATHRRMLELSGECADGVILMGAADVEMTRWQLDRIAEGAERSGRTLADLDIELWAALALGDDVTDAVKDVKAWAASEARVLNSWKGELPGDLERFRAELDNADRNYVMSEHLSVAGPNASLISDELAARLAFAGSGEQCAERILALRELGISGVTITLQSGGRDERLERLASDLLPRLKTLRA